MSRSLMQEAGHLRLVERPKRPLTEVDEEHRYPDAAESDRRRQIPDAEQLGIVEVGYDVPVNVDHPHEHDEDGQLDESLAGALAFAREQQREGQRKVQRHDRKNDVAPLAANAMQVPADFVG